MIKQEATHFFTGLEITLDKDFLEKKVEGKYRATVFLGLLQSIRAQIKDLEGFFLVRFFVTFSGSL